MPKVCVVCRERPPVVPDRDRPGRPIKRVCRECHVARLQQDLKHILKVEQRKLAEEKKTFTSVTGEEWELNAVNIAADWKLRGL
jgi:hypothetical protein